MIKTGILAGGALIALALCPTAQSADWDHDANIGAGVHELVATYQLAGEAGMSRLVGGCYDLIAERKEADDRLRQLEYCAGMDFAAVHLSRVDERIGQGEAAFFSLPKVVTRVARLSEFLADPNVGNQVMRAWSAASAEALGREGF